MKTKVVKIGNSRGIRIPKSIIEQSGLKNEVELELNNGKIIIKPVKHTRENWDTAFQEMAKKGDDVLLYKNELNSQTIFDEENWVW